MQLQIKLNEQELQALYTLIDLGVRQGGARYAKLAAVCLDRLEAARPDEDLDKAPEEETDDE